MEFLRTPSHTFSRKSTKGNPDDRRCALEAQLQSDEPLCPSHDAEDTDKAIRGVCDKLKALLDTRIEKQCGY